MNKHCTYKKNLGSVYTEDNVLGIAHPDDKIGQVSLTILSNTENNCHRCILYREHIQCPR